MIGLLMIRDEADVLAEVLTNHSKFCSSILVLDGTVGPEQAKSEEIARSFPAVRGYWRDDQTGIEPPLRDGARWFLLEVARKMWGFGHWYAVLHGDEIWTVDPREKLATLPRGILGGVVSLYHFFPHISQRDSWSFEPGVDSIEQLCRYYMRPAIREERLFFDAGTFDYEPTRHSKVIPSGIESADLDIALKQFNYRSSTQATTRAQSRAGAGWQRNHYQHLLDETRDGFFVESLANPEFQWAASVPLGEGTVHLADDSTFATLL